MNILRSSDGLVNMVKASTTCSSTRSIQDEVTHQSRLKMNKQEQGEIEQQGGRMGMGRQGDGGGVQILENFAGSHPP